MEDVNEILRISAQDKVLVEKEQNIYSLIKTVEFLEYAYMTGKVKGQEYHTEFQKMLN